VKFCGGRGSAPGTGKRLLRILKSGAISADIMSSAVQTTKFNQQRREQNFYPGIIFFRPNAGG
jgi:hypothetical protein